MAEGKDILLIFFGLLTFSLVIFSLADSSHQDRLDVDYLTAEEFNLNKGVLEDLRIPSNEIRVQGVINTPDYVTFKGGLQALAFDAGTMEQAFIEFQIPHSKEDDTPLLPHFHTSVMENASGVVVMCMEYSCANISEEFTNDMFLCTSINETNKAFIHLETDSTWILYRISASGMCVGRIYRNATDARDTYPNDVILHEFDIHYYASRLGMDID